MSNRGRYIVEAIVVEHEAPASLIDPKGVPQWIYNCLERFEKGGYASLEPARGTGLFFFFFVIHQVEAKSKR